MLRVKIKSEEVLTKNKKSKIKHGENSSEKFQSKWRPLGIYKKA